MKSAIVENNLLLLFSLPRYEVEAILKSKEEEGKRLYLIKWKGYERRKSSRLSLNYMVTFSLVT